MCRAAKSLGELLTMITDCDGSAIICPVALRVAWYDMRLDASRSALQSPDGVHEE
jgi:hypothetical protein